MHLTSLGKPVFLILFFQTATGIDNDVIEVSQNGWSGILDLVVYFNNLTHLIFYVVNKTFYFYFK